LPSNSLESIIELDEAVNDDSTRSGVRLCELACNELRIAPQPLELIVFHRAAPCARIAAIVAA
jgi:hypothetical protein